MPKQIDPIERALDAYADLSPEQKEIFQSLLRIAEKHFRKYIGTTAEPAPKPARGRPPGSKNKARNPLAPESFDAAQFIALNGAVTEEL